MQQELDRAMQREREMSMKLQREQERVKQLLQAREELVKCVRHELEPMNEQHHEDHERLQAVLMEQVFLLHRKLRDVLSHSKNQQEIQVNLERELVHYKENVQEVLVHYRENVEKVLVGYRRDLEKILMDNIENLDKILVQDDDDHDNDGNKQLPPPYDLLRFFRKTS